METNNILEIKNLRKNFGSFLALNNINIEIKEGHIVGLLGKNGAGKTTLIKTILGLYRDSDGEIFYQGTKLNTNDEKVMRTIGVLVDTKFHEDLSAYDNLMMLLMASGCKNKQERKDTIVEILELVDLLENAKDKVKTFSMGMKQRLALAQALMLDVKLLILDEPFVGLDPLGIELIKEKLKSLCRVKKVSIIFSSHQLAEVADLSEDIIVINEGNISFSGTYDSLVYDAKKYCLRLDKSIVEYVDDELLKYLVIQDAGKTIIFKKNDDILNDILLIVEKYKISVADIDVEENALLSLFSNAQGED